MKTIFHIILFTSLFTQGIYSQWATKYTSMALADGVISGWMNFKQAGDGWENRMYYLDATSFKIMSDMYSNTIQYSYNFTSDEILAGYQIYSIRYDLTGDGIVEFYVMSYSGMSSNYREGFKVFDITTGNILFEKKETNYSYSYPVIWDMDNDKLLECVVTKTEYPSGLYYYQEVYSTGVGILTDSPQESYQPAQFELRQNYPNPFNPSTTIEFNLPSSSPARLEIFDARGSLVRTLVNDQLNEGKHKVTWDGKNNSGTVSSSGIYFYRLEANGVSGNKKMVILK